MIQKMKSLFKFPSQREDNTDSDNSSDNQSGNDEIRELTESGIIPYDNWHDNCYACGTDMEKTRSEESIQFQTRGQFVIHRGNSAEQTAAVGLCQKCTRHMGTIIENWDEFEPAVDVRKREDF